MKTGIYSGAYGPERLFDLQSDPFALTFFSSRFVRATRPISQHFVLRPLSSVHLRPKLGGCRLVEDLDEGGKPKDPMPLIKTTKLLVA